MLIGGASNAVPRRVATWGDGYIYGSGADPAAARKVYNAVEAAWQEARRQGKPRFVAGIYCGLGQDAGERATAYVRSYYGNAPVAEAMAKAVHTTAQRIKDSMKAFSDVGLDELLLWPCVPEIEMFYRLAELV